MTTDTGNDSTFSDVVMQVRWWARREADLPVIEARLKCFTGTVREQEPGTLTYLVYRPETRGQESAPAVSTREILYIERYASDAAFQEHLQRFDREVGIPLADRFLCAPNNPDQSYVLVANGALCRGANGRPSGFIRPNGPETAAITQVVSWWVKPDGDKRAVLDKLTEFVGWVHENEPGTLLYIISDPVEGNMTPPGNPGLILFMAAYESEEAKEIHIANWNQQIIAPLKSEFVPSANDPDTPLITVETVNLVTGFSRDDIWGEGTV